MSLTARARARGAGLALGFLADRLLGDPRRGHPVALFGTAARRLEHRTYRDARGRGAWYAAALVGGVALLGAAGERVTLRNPLLHTGVTALATWTVLGGRTLEREAEAIHGHLADDDLAGARQRLTHLVSRDTRSLSEQEVARAVVESVAENTSDAVVAPLVWGAVAGVPGLLAYRAANTLDAMVGYRNARYASFGWASARLDDLLNLPGARLTGVAVLLARPGRARCALRAWRRDAAAHPSPNAGVVEAAFAGALGITLGGRNSYPDTGAAEGAQLVEERHTLGDGPPAGVGTIAETVLLARRVDRVALAMVVVGVLAQSACRKRMCTRPSSIATSAATP
ncbi:cobalamin biosynthesis protein [Nocardioides dubius]|uniref:cobalamin biosynthesis protein n=1 Tax=Nocardioides dubius TaxID=317019 RepID=UPI0031D2AC39